MIWVAMAVWVAVACTLSRRDRSAAASQMPWFYCDDCGDTIKKPKITQHYHQCSASRFTCIDCSANFDRHSVQSHTQCVTEHEKYALGATKPGGYAASGFAGEGAAKPTEGGQAEGLEFLSTRAPWKCSICNVSCTSQDTLVGHAAGAKHKRRAKAALAAKNGGQQAAAVPATETQPAAQQDAAVAEKHGKDAKAKKQKKCKKDAKGVAAAAEEPAENGGKKESKKKKRKAEAAAEVEAGVTATPAEDADKGSSKKKKATAVKQNGTAMEAAADEVKQGAEDGKKHNKGKKKEKKEKEKKGKAKA